MCIRDSPEPRLLACYSSDGTQQQLATRPGAATITIYYLLYITILTIQLYYYYYYLLLFIQLYYYDYYLLLFIQLYYYYYYLLLTIQLTAPARQWSPPPPPPPLLPCVLSHRYAHERPGWFLPAHVRSGQQPRHRRFLGILLGKPACTPRTAGISGGGWERERESV